MRKIFLILIVALLTLTGAAQEDDASSDPSSMSNQSDDMGGEMLGGSAETAELASQEVDSLPETSLRWIVFDVAHVDDEVAVGSVAAALVYAHEGSHTVTLAGEEMNLEEGQASFVEGDELGLAGAEGLWLSLLIGADADIPAQLGDADVIAKSDVLRGVPQEAGQLSFVMVELPMDSATAVHSHPGPEFIYVTRGEIEYQTGVTGTEALSVADGRTLSAGVAVQKRNPAGERAAFISWFVVDPDAPFAMEASFE